MAVPNRGVTSAPSVLDEVLSLVDPLALLDLAWAMEPAQRLSERRAALDRLEALLAAAQTPAAPAGRDWQLELWAERAIDAAAADELESALELSGRVLADPAPASSIATARATLARGRALAWLGTDENTRAGEGVLAEAAERFAALPHTEWQGFTLFWIGHAICYENGRLLEAERRMAEALEILPDSSPRRATVLSFYADVLIDLGAWDRADSMLDEAYRLAEITDDPTSRAYVTWSRAHISAGRGDAVGAERRFREVERDATDWWQNSGAYFLCDAARTLDTLGLTEPARGYLRRARALLESTTIGSGQVIEDFEPLAQARALILARSGDPALALEELQALTRRRWLEKRLLWRFTLMGSWAMLRAGNRDGAAREAARALESAEGLGGLIVAVAGEPDITAALAPLAAEAGYGPARRLLAPSGELVICLFGPPEVARADGTIVALAPGRPAELVRMLALHPHGLPVEVVLEAFFPETAPPTSRHRLRQVLTRLRAVAGEIVVREEDMLKLAPAWVDVREFQALARRARASRGTRRLILATAARALTDRGPLLVADPYAEWAQETRQAVTDAMTALQAA